MPDRLESLESSLLDLLPLLALSLSSSVSGIALLAERTFVLARKLAPGRHREFWEVTSVFVSADVQNRGPNT